MKILPLQHPGHGVPGRQADEVLGGHGLHPAAVKVDEGLFRVQHLEDLAKTIVARYHSRTAAEHEAGEFIRVLRQRELPEKIEAVTLTVSESKLWLPRLLVDANLAASTSEARRLITQGGVQLEGEKVTDAKLELAAGKTYLLQVGKRRFKRVTLAGS